MRKPQGEPRGSEVDDLENISLHAMIKEKEDVIAVARLTYFPSGEGQVRFMGVKEAYRGQKMGSKLLTYLEGEAVKIGINKVFLNARENAIPFYESRGYKEEGEHFRGVAGIMHVRMVKSF